MATPFTRRRGGKKKASSRSFTSPGYVEELPYKGTVPVNWKKMQELYIPLGIMNILGYQFGGPRALMGTLLPGMMEFDRHITGSERQSLAPGYNREFTIPW
tara:strand:+ start:617 stop:919 length:303 start_codon:yes stop_codon:yes gene_type:complete